MKKITVVLLALIASTANMQAQGLIVYKTDGTTIKLPAEEVQRIVAYDYGDEPESLEAVDLGLPSGTKWANMNIGATSPQENGLYFAWGETTGYTSDTTDGRLFDWANYKWMTEGQSTWKYINKYQADDKQTDACWYEYDQNSGDYKFVGDGLTVLERFDDAAAANWGGDWRMPTIEEIEELFDNCTSEWVTEGDVCGRKFTSKFNDNSIFFPAAGNREEGILNDAGISGRYWSASLSTDDNSCYGRLLHFNSKVVDFGGNIRWRGLNVRAVVRQNSVQD